MKKGLALTLAAVMALGMMSGCNGNNGKGGSGGDVSQTKYGAEYPLESDVTLTYWMPMTSNISSGAENYGELPVAKELEKLTGVKIEYIHPSITNATEKFNLMVSSKDLADIIEYTWDYYPGGPAKAVSDGVILPLNDMMDSWAPDFKREIEKDAEIAKYAKTDAGQYYATGIIAADRKLNTTAGPIMRLDWLEELGLEKPETMDEWYTVLKAFKEQKGAKAPLSLDISAIVNGAFIGAYNVGYDYYRDGDVVKFGAAEPGYKDFLTTMKKWYDEGLLDNNFSTTDGATIKANMLNGHSGATWNALGGGIGTLTTGNPDGVYGGVPYPTHKKGERPQFGQASSRFNAEAAISSQCKDSELAMKWLNYGYTEAGHMFYNFGIEGTSYELVDKDGAKYPKYTDLITKNPDGLSMSQVLTMYSHGGQGGNFSQDVRYLEQYAALPVQQDAWTVWGNTDAFEHAIPFVAISDADSAAYTDICTYRDEMYIKFISGTESLDKFDDYVNKLKEMGLDKVTAAKQAAYDAFRNR